MSGSGTWLLVQVSVISSLIGGCLLLASQRSAAWRCGTLRLAFWLAAGLPVLLWLPGYAIPMLAAGDVAEIVGSAVPAASDPLPWTFVLAVWAIGSLFGIWRVAKDLLALRTILVRCRPSEGPTLSGRKTRILLSETAGAPFTVGLFHPVIVLPVAAETWTAQRTMSVLAHEEAHVARRDWIQMLAMRLMRALAWPNLILHVLDRLARLACEEASDDLVLLASVPARDYARHLLTLAQGGSNSVPPGAVAGAFDSPTALERRVRSILATGKDRRRPRVAAFVAASGLLLLATVGVGALRAAPIVDKRPLGWGVRLLHGGVIGGEGTVLSDTSNVAGRSESVTVHGPAILARDRKGALHVFRP